MDMGDNFFPSLGCWHLAKSRNHNLFMAHVPTIPDFHLPQVPRTNPYPPKKKKKIETYILHRAVAAIAMKINFN